MNALKVVTIVNSTMDLVKILLVVGNVIVIPVMKSKRMEHVQALMNVPQEVIVVMNSQQLVTISMATLEGMNANANLVLKRIQTIILLAKMSTNANQLMMTYFLVTLCTVRAKILRPVFKLLLASVNQVISMKSL